MIPSCLPFTASPCQGLVSSGDSIPTDLPILPKFPHTKPLQECNPESISKEQAEHPAHNRDPEHWGTGSSFTIHPYKPRATSAALLWLCLMDPMLQELQMDLQALHSPCVALLSSTRQRVPLPKDEPCSSKPPLQPQAA